MRVIDLSGPDGNAFHLIGIASSFCKQLQDVDPVKFDKKEIVEDMMSGDYKHLIETFEFYFSPFVTLTNKP